MSRPTPAQPSSPAAPAPVPLKSRPRTFFALLAIFFVWVGFLGLLNFLT